MHRDLELFSPLLDLAMNFLSTLIGGKFSLADLCLHINLTF